MFYYISGTLAKKAENFLVVDAGGIGYKIFTSSTTLQTCGAVGDAVKVYTYMNIGEMVCDLYGFLTEEEIGMFTKLISVSGVGAKAATALLSAMPTSALALAIVTGDGKMLTRANGIGPKAAQRIILELKDKIGNDEMIAKTAPDLAVVAQSNPSDEAVEALLVLGYSMADAKTALAGVDQSQDLELVIRDALKKLAR